MHVAITGASSGIGEGLAAFFSRRGDRLTLVARREDLLRAVAARVGGAPHVVRRDLGDLDACTGWVEEAEGVHGPIDLLINNAGVQYVEPGLGVADDRAEALMRINYLAPMRLVRRVVPRMVARRSGAVVNVSSMAGLIATPNMVDYSASKAALAMASEMLRVELAPAGVHVLTVYPGPVTSPMETAAREKFIAHGAGGARAARAVPTGTVDGLARRIDRAVRARRPRVIYPGVYWLAYWFRASSQWATSRLTPLL